MRQQFVELVDGVVSDPAEHVTEPGERIDFDQLTGGNETAQHRGCFPAVVAAEKCPVVTIMCDRT